MHGPVNVKKADCLVCRIHPSIHPASRQTAIQNNKYQMSHKYSCSSWWWTWRVPKHVEVINKIDELYWEYRAPSWFHLQGYMEMDGQQNTNTPVPHQLRTAMLTADTQCNVPLLPIYYCMLPWLPLCLCSGLCGGQRNNCVLARCALSIKHKIHCNATRWQHSDRWDWHCE